MFIGRKNELQLLDSLNTSGKFEFLVLYGRRRVGKTSLLKEFSKNKEIIFFSAQEKNDSLNLQDFSRTVQNFFEGRSFSSFESWQKAFEYIDHKSSEKHTTIIIDEFPFIASENPSVKSILQHTIDHEWSNKNIFLILCGSSVSFMENDVMGYKSPLYGRSTSQLELLPFDYLDSAEFFKNYTATDKIAAYGILGGIPCYLQAFDANKSIKDNIARSILRTGSFLAEEPQSMLKMELRDPAVYNSIFEAIANGASRMNDITTKIHEDASKCSKYLKTLIDLKLISRNTPCGEDDSSRKTLYTISDNFFSFWYRFIFTEKSYYELIGEEAAAEEITAPESINDYMGLIFEKICQQYIIRLAKQKKLPFIPHQIGKWWGTNNKLKRQDDCDILLLGKGNKHAIFCECKFKNSPLDKKEYDDLCYTADNFSNVAEKYFYFFSKGGFTEWIKEKAQTSTNIVLVEPADLFNL